MNFSFNSLKIPVLIASFVMAMAIGSNAQCTDCIDADLLPKFTSPEAGSLGKYVSLPINLNTGTPDITVPVYTVQYGGMEVPIYMSYDASGVKVEDIASPIGLKWNLMAGGSIMRIVRGGHDEGNPHVPVPQGCGASSGGYYKSRGFESLMDDVACFESDNYGFKNYFDNLSRGWYDAQPDLFSFNALGYSGKFLFDNQRNAVIYDGSDVQIEVTYDASALRFSAWKITLEDGMQLTFAGSEAAVDRSYVGLDENHWMDNAWMLTKVHHPKTGLAVLFNYHPDKNVYSSASISSKTTLTCFNYDGGGGSCIYDEPDEVYCNSSIQNGDFNDGINRLSRVNHSVPILSSIVAGDLEVLFSTSSRTDVTPFLGSSPRKIDAVEVRYQENCLKQYDFHYDYFESTLRPSSDGLFGADLEEASKRRLKLTAFDDSSCDGAEVLTHTFEYEEGRELPPRISFAKDHWGYYNGANTNSSLYPDLFPDNTSCSSSFFGDRGVHPEYLATGTLKKITYPTRGSVSFDYEVHQSDVAVVPTRKGHESIGRLRTTSPFSTDSPYLTTASMPFVYRRGMKVTGTLTGWFNCVPGTADHTAIRIFDTNNAVVFSYGYSNVGKTSPVDSELLDFHLDDLSLLTGGSYRLETYGLASAPAPTQRMCYYSEISLEEEVVLPHQPEDYYVGGLRVNRIDFRDRDGASVESKSYAYESSTLVSKPDYLYRLRFDASKPINGLTLVGLRSDDFIYTQWYQAVRSGTYYLITTDDPYQVDFAGSHIAYNQVTETNGLGSTHYTFIPPATYFELNGYQEIDQIPISPLIQTELAGRLLSKDIKDNEGHSIQREAYYYATKGSAPIGAPIRAFNVNTLGANGGIGFMYYEVQPVRSDLDFKVETRDGVTFRTDYYYEGNGHRQVTLEKMTKSSGEEVAVQYQYAKDVSTVTPAISQLIMENRLSEVITRETQVDSERITRTEHHYEVTNGKALKSKTTGQYEGNEVYDEVSYDRYDPEGNVLQVTYRSGISTTYIWGYDRRYPIAKIENARFSEVAAALGVSEAALENWSEDQVAALDGLRSLMTNAQIYTYTYQPEVGMTSQTDANNITVYYEYDGLQRLVRVRDHEDGIVAAYDYHYATD